MPYEGEERRKDNRDLTSKIILLEERLHNFIEHTTEFRDILCTKIDELKNDMRDLRIKIGDLPCKERQGWYQSLTRQMVFMWGLISLIIFALMKELFFK